MTRGISDRLFAAVSTDAFISALESNLRKLTVLEISIVRAVAFYFFHTDIQSGIRFSACIRHAVYRKGLNSEIELLDKSEAAMIRIFMTKELPAAFEELLIKIQKNSSECLEESR